MIQLSSFSAVRYRGIDGLTLPNLSKANLITGANGVGKTALIEAMWLFTGRYNPSLLWNANVQRSPVHVSDPIYRLTDGELELSGKENGKLRAMKLVFEKIDGSSTNIPVEDGLPEGAKNLQPVVGFIRIYLDGEPPKVGKEGIHLTSTVAVIYQSPIVPSGRPNCIIESVKFQHEIFKSGKGRPKKRPRGSYQHGCERYRGCRDIDRRRRERVVLVSSNQERKSEAAS